MNIAIGGIMHESNTFAPQAADRTRFAEGSMSSGPDMLPVWKDAYHEFGGFIGGAEKYGYSIVPTVMAWANPAGPVADDIFDEIVDGIITAAKKQPIDGLLIALHGAMVTGKHLSGDTEVLRRIREAFPKIPMAVSFDYHGNLSPKMAEYADIIVGYQTYPHIDQRQRGLLAAELLTRTIKKEIRPVTYIAKRAMILNLLGQATEREPMRSLLMKARQAEQRPGMLSTSVMAGFPFADVPDMGPSVIAVHNGDRAVAKEVAEELAQRMWDVRHELYVPCPSPAEAVTLALAADRTPVLLIDLGDNIGGGSAGDGTVLLAEILKQNARGAIVALYAPEAVQTAMHLGVGKYFSGVVGGALDKLHGDPVRVGGLIRSIHDGKWVETEARHGGRRHNDQGPTVVLNIDNSNTLILNSFRTPPFSLGQITSLGLDPRAARMIVVKAAVAYKAAYEPIAGRIIEVDTPGVTASNPKHFKFERIARPMFPLDGE
ncbi:MAG: M81 family metallopeptidase [Planctomycetes bacterium]|nr:M81 family metallopeptidase [Planctomycetota bacterium]